MFYVSNHPSSEDSSNPDPEGWRTHQVPYSDTHSSTSNYPSLETDTWPFDHIIGNYIPTSAPGTGAGSFAGSSMSLDPLLSPLVSLDSESEPEPESDLPSDDPHTLISESRSTHHHQGRGYGPNTPGAPPPNPPRSLISSTPAMPTTPARVPRHFRYSRSRPHPGQRPTPNARPVPHPRSGIRSLPDFPQPQPPSPSPRSQPHPSPRHVHTSPRGQSQNRSRSTLPSFDGATNTEQHPGAEGQCEDGLGDADAEGDTDEEYLGDEDAEGDIDEECLCDEDAEGDVDEEWVSGDEDAEGDVDEEWAKGLSGRTSSNASSH